MRTIGALLTAAFLLIAVKAYAADDCFTECNTTIWQLMYRGSVVSFGDMNFEECEELKAELEAQTVPFSELICIEVPVAREKI